MCSAGSISVFACSWAALRYWWVGHFNTLNAIPRETELTPHFHSTNSSGWKKIPRPTPLASKLQLAASGHRTVLGKKHNCLLCLSVPPPSPRAHRSWSSPCHLLTGADLCFRFITHRSSALQSSADRFGHSTQTSRKKCQIRSGEHHPYWEHFQANTQSCCIRSRQAPNPNFGMTPPSLIPWSCILQALALSGLGFWQLHTWSFMDKTRFRQHFSEYRSSPPMCTLPGLGWPSARLQVGRPSRIPSRSRVKSEMVEMLPKNIQPHCHPSEQQVFYQSFPSKEGIISQ